MNWKISVIQIGFVFIATEFLHELDVINDRILFELFAGALEDR